MNLRTGRFNISGAARVVCATLALAGMSLAVHGNAIAAGGGVRKAATDTTISLSANPLPVHTSTGKNLKVSISADEDIPSDPSSAESLSLAVDVETPGGVSEVFDTVGAASKSPYGEGHGWQFELSPDSLLSTSKMKTASLNTGKQLSPYGTISLHFAQSKVSSEDCTSGSEYDHTGTATVKFRFNTLSSEWGVIGSLKKTETFPGNAELDVDHDCDSTGSVGVSPNECESGFLVISPQMKVTNDTGKVLGEAALVGESAHGADGSHEAELEALAILKLPVPAHTEREDVLTDTAGPMSYNSTTKVVGVRSFHGKIPVFTGGATVSLGTVTPKTSTTTCKDGKVKKTETTEEYDDLQWSTISGDRLTAHLALPGNLTPKDSAKAEVILISYA